MTHSTSWIKVGQVTPVKLHSWSIKISFLWEVTVCPAQHVLPHGGIPLPSRKPPGLKEPSFSEESEKSWSFQPVSSKATRNDGMVMYGASDFFATSGSKLSGFISQMHHSHPPPMLNNFTICHTCCAQMSITRNMASTVTSCSCCCDVCWGSRQAIYHQRCFCTVHRDRIKRHLRRC